MTASAADLRHLPLFRSLSTDQLESLLSALAPKRIAAGKTLFSAGETPSSFQILASGEVELEEEGEPKIVLKPFAPIGELGALTGLPRNATAKALTEVTILEAPMDALMRVFAQSSDLAFVFYKSLLGVVSEKVRRDKLRTDDMRKNLIRTQKTMKELRELILSAEETPLSQPVCEKLDDLIEKNRRAHYRVSPLESHPASLHMQNGSNGARVAIVELSQGFLKLHSDAKLDPGHEVVGVLTLPRGEIPVSGRVERTGTDGVLVKLDLLIDDYATSLSRYIVELQMLDFVV